jgi:hypothetical protein
MTTKKAYLYNLGAYLDFLREVKEIALSPDELIVDNLKAVFESKAIDVATKRRHTDWVLEYANVYLLRKGAPEGSRKVAGSIIKTWYQRNDSPLFGDFQVSTSDTTGRPASRDSGRKSRPQGNGPAPEAAASHRPSNLC